MRGLGRFLCGGGVCCCARAPALARPLPHEMREVLRLELDADNLVVAAEFRHATFRIHRRKRRLVVARAEIFFRAERGGYRELRHYRVGIELIFLDHIRDFACGGYDLGAFGEKRRHFVRGLEIFLARVDHALGVAHLRARGKR